MSKLTDCRDARRRDRQGRPARGAARPGGGRLRGRLRPRRHRLGLLDQGGQRPAASGPSSCSRSTRSACSGRSPPSRKDKAEAELSPALQGQGLRLLQPDRHACASTSTSTSASARAVAFPGNPLNFIRRKPDGGFEEPKVNAVIFRQNTEGLYCRRRVDQPAGAGPQGARDAQEDGRRSRTCRGRGPGRLAAASSPATACRRICQAAFEYAKKFGYKSVTICEKPNVIRETSRHDARTRRKAIAEGLPRHRAAGRPTSTPR